ncbi:MAG TPA: flavin reductase family protein [Firmicutes bacterium]|nr:flavin reductase family protein [Bacillota bacterium]
MKKEIIKNRHRLINQSSIILVSCQLASLKNIITVGWYQIIDINPILVGISIGQDRYSHRIIKESRVFGINVPLTDIIEKVWCCGKTSGKDTDKFIHCNLSFFYGHYKNLPLINECPGNIECRLTRFIDFKSHTLFIGEVKAAYVEEEYYDGYWIPEKTNLIFPFHLGGDYILESTPVRKKVEFKKE